MHKALLLWEDEPVNNKRTYGFRTSRPLPNIVYSMTVICDRHVVWYGLCKPVNTAVVQASAWWLLISGAYLMIGPYLPVVDGPCPHPCTPCCRIGVIKNRQVDMSKIKSSLQKRQTPLYTECRWCVIVALWFDWNLSISTCTFKQSHHRRCCLSWKYLWVDFPSAPEFISC